MQKAEELGDTIETVSKGLNIPCGCKHRKEKVNTLIFPYK